MEFFIANDEGKQCLNKLSRYYSLSPGSLSGICKESLLLKCAASGVYDFLVGNELHRNATVLGKQCPRGRGTSDGGVRGSHRDLEKEWGVIWRHELEVHIFSKPKRGIDLVFMEKFQQTLEPPGGDFLFPYS